MKNTKRSFDISLPQFPAEDSPPCYQFFFDTQNGTAPALPPKKHNAVSKNIPCCFASGIARTDHSEFFRTISFEK
jgi:hypothetical protein